jgi:hypothetical protein
MILAGRLFVLTSSAPIDLKIILRANSSLIPICMGMEANLPHTCPLGADIAAAARIPFPAHRHSVVAAHRRVAAEGDNNTDLGP